MASSNGTGGRAGFPPGRLTTGMIGETAEQDLRRLRRTTLSSPEMLQNSASFDSDAYNTFRDEFGDMPQRGKARFGHEFRLTDNGGSDETEVRFRWKVFDANADTILTEAWGHVRVDATLAGWIITMPVSTNFIGMKVRVVKSDATANIVTATVQVGENLNVPAGANLLSAQWAGITLIAVPGGWELAS